MERKPVCAHCVTWTRQPSRLSEISEQLLTPEWTDEQVRTFLTEKQGRMTEAVTTIYGLARPADDNYDQEIVARYPAVRRFFPARLAHNCV